MKSISENRYVLLNSRDILEANDEILISGVKWRPVSVIWPLRVGRRIGDIDETTVSVFRRLVSMPVVDWVLLDYGSVVLDGDEHFVYSGQWQPVQRAQIGGVAGACVIRRRNPVLPPIEPEVKRVSVRINRIKGTLSQWLRLREKCPDIESAYAQAGNAVGLFTKEDLDGFELLPGWDATVNLEKYTVPEGFKVSK